MNTPIQRYNHFPPVAAHVGKRTPGDGFVKMPLPQGVGYHTGGVYLSPDGKSVFKALDCRTDHGEDAPRVRTQEDIVLEVMAGLPGFPRNWHIERRNERDWLVRPLALTVPGIELRLEDVQRIEAGIRTLNEKNWELGDTLEAAIDPLTREPFVLDLSCAYYRGPKCPELYRDDTFRFDIWAKSVGFAHFSSFRGAARHVVQTARFKLKYPKEYTHVFAATRGPFHTPTDIPEALAIDADYEGVYTWVVFPKRIDAAVAECLQLTWGWSPLAYSDEE